MIDDKCVRKDYTPVFTIKKGFVYTDDKSGKTAADTTPKRYQLYTNEHIMARLTGMGRGSHKKNHQKLVYIIAKIYVILASKIPHQPINL